MHDSYVSQLEVSTHRISPIGRAPPMLEALQSLNRQLEDGNFLSAKL